MTGLFPAWIALSLFVALLWMSKPKIGAGALQAFLRQGAKELGQILPAFPDSVRVVEEPGAFGNPTAVEVYQSKQQDATKAVELDTGARPDRERSIEPELGR